jgi:hypothetical protein
MSRSYGEKSAQYFFRAFLFFFTPCDIFFFTNFYEEFFLKKKTILICLLALLAATAFAKPINFTLINHTDYDITEVHFAATNDEEWGDDILGGDPLLYRGSMEISFDADYEATIKKENLKLFDMLCVIDDEEVEIYDLELAKITTIELSLDKKGNLVTKIK